MKQTDTGIFLHRTSFSESSVIATFYTRNQGIQKFIFQGAKKKNNTLFPLNICELNFYRRPDSELGKLTQADTAVVLDSIVINPVKSIIAFFMADVIRQSLQTNEKETTVFEFLREAICELNDADDLVLFPLFFLVNFAPFIGIQPSLCDDEALYFNLKEGEFHSDYRPGEWCIEGEQVRHLYGLFESNTIAPAFRKQAFETILDYYQLHIPRFDVSKSLDIIRETLA
ncbi:DNA repair protein RecO [Crocinitomicaceae bacterium CZZ-1]|uniref:DNA repair protein RecO n=1 Tax=Taishania pollutisoli TaxID=2766479 RepID=A0A8J6PH99_9FLAO|nr:DNA repair protein RecO [Taishania pollutisoli]MBC9811414.1 DNA repair protein RecO [Taishania pollutisoli]